MKNVTLRIPEELYNRIYKLGEEINCSTHAMIMVMIKLGMKVYGDEVTLSVSEKELEQLFRSSSQNP